MTGLISVKNISDFTVNQMASSNFPGTLSPSDLVFRIAKGEEDFNRLDISIDWSVIDVCDNDGRTPLMIACLDGMKDAVNFLLQKGANPNLQCNKGNTPLHYACCVGVSELHSSDEVDRRINILQNLTEYGASLMHNCEDLIPPCIAAFYGEKELVDFFFVRDGIELSVRESIRIYELLGVSQAFQTSFYPTLVLDSFSEALRLKNGSSVPLAENRNQSELTEWLASSGKQECETLEGMQSIKADHHAIKVHAILVGDRVLSSDLKKVYFLPELLHHASDCLFESNNPDIGYHIFNFLLLMEQRCQLPFGSVLRCIPKKINSYQNLDTKVLQRTSVLIQRCAEILLKVDSSVVVPMSDALKKHCAELLFNLGFYYSDPEVLESVLFSVEKMLCHIQKTIEGNCDSVLLTTSVVYCVMKLLARAFIYNMYSGITSGALRRVKHVIGRLGTYEDMKHVNEHGDTVLHILMDKTFVASDMNYITSLATLFIRLGCPVEMTNRKGETAKDVLLKRTGEAHVDLLALVSAPTSPLRLEKIASRALLRWNIPFRHLLPSGLIEIVEGEGFDSE